MNIVELLAAGKEVQFELDGEKHRVEMRPPTAAVARTLREQFYALGQQVNAGGDNTAADMAVEFEVVIAGAVKACFPPDSVNANMSDDDARLFVLRIGGDKSDVVRAALRFCGIQYDAADGDDGDGDAGTDASF